MKKIAPTKFLLAALIMLPAAAHAQAAPITVVENMQPHLTLAIIAGVILAVAFQLVLSGLSLAGGLSLTPNLMKSAAKARVDRLAGDDTAHEDAEHEHKHHLAASLAIVNQLGIWSLVTTSVSLFLATWLAMRLSFIYGDEYRYVMATVVWAAFMGFITYLEWKSMRSLLGGLASIASSGFHAGSGFLNGLITKSPAHQLEDVARHTMHSVFKDLSRAARKSDLPKVLGRYLQDVKPDGLDYDRIHDDLVDIIRKANDLSDIGEEKVLKLLKKKLQDRHPLITGANLLLLAAAISRALRSAKEANRASDGVFGALEAFVPLAEGQARELREKIETYLAGTNRSELDPESIRQDIEKMVAEPGTAIGLIKSRLSLFDRDTVKALIAQNSNLDSEKADKIVESILGAADQLKTKYRSTVEAARDQVQSVSGSVEEQISAYLDAHPLPEIDYSTIQAQIEDVLHNIGDAPHIIRERLKDLNQEKIVEMLKNNRFLSQKQTDTLLLQITQTRDAFTQHVTEIEEKATAAYETMRRKTVIAAEHARKASVAAAWWLVGTAILSLGASLAGAYFSKMVIGL